MTDRLVIEVDDAQAQRWFGQLLQRGSDLSGLMLDIGELLTDSSKARFKTGIAPDGSPWAPLADGSGRTPLLKTGRMRDDIAPTSGVDWVEVNAGAKQARWHQEGTAPYTIKPKSKKALAWAGGPGPRKSVSHPGLPARRFIGISRSDVDGVTRLTAAWLGFD